MTRCNDNARRAPLRDQAMAGEDARRLLRRSGERTPAGFCRLHGESRAIRRMQRMLCRTPFCAPSPISANLRPGPGYPSGSPALPSTRR